MMNLFIYLYKRIEKNINNIASSTYSNTICSNLYILEFLDTGQLLGRLLLFL